MSDYKKTKLRLRGLSHEAGNALDEAMNLIHDTVDYDEPDAHDTELDNLYWEMDHARDRIMVVIDALEASL